ncbi:putative amino acid permease YvbW [Lentibacillus sp. JNUCC-1]|uniref:APC family permease n=1 Tax=Lentibacillus sp. JNUCC-1 TaxID=2654513 RepID=UPI0013240BBA|nr:APC family permease [Lentibacillus sp. JNUCC-1]MUV36417.1 putative amino acid permease YvbW [Lentibacillus sp. JNUCC-1]
MSKKLEQFGYQQELHRTLSFRDLLVYGLIFMVPIAPFGIYGEVMVEAHGMVALAYLIGMVGMIFTAWSYARMSEAFPMAGSVYSYAGRGINQYVGFIAGWAILLDYILVPALLYVVSATALTGMWPAVPGWFWLIFFILINTVINYFGIKFTARTNMIFLVFELMVLIIFLVVGIHAIATGVNGATFSFDPLYNPDTFSMSVVMGAVSIAVLSFLGFDAISTLSEESAGGPKAIGKATVYSLLIVGVLFMVQTWVAALIYPDFNSFEDIGTAFYETATIAGGEWLGVLTAIATALAWGIADALVAQVAISRVLFSMGRDRKLPKFLSKVHPKHKTPYASILVVAVISVVIGLIFMGDIGILTSFINFGALTAFMFLHVSVFVHYVLKNGSRNYFAHMVLPLIGFIIIAYVWINLATQAKMLGLAWVAVGCIVAIYFAIKKKNPSLD